MSDLSLVSLRRLPAMAGLSVAAALSLSAILPATSGAVPIVPSAAPLSADLPAYPAACPEPDELDGTKATDLLAKLVRGPSLSLFGLTEGLASVPAPAVFVCDPAAAGARRILGPITGNTTIPASRDLSWFGTRGLILAASGTRTPSLMPGDRVELPVVGANANLTASVATAGGARTIAVPPQPAAPTAVAVEGTSEAPVLVVARGGAPATRIPVTPRRAHRVQVRATVTGSAITFSGRAAPRTLVAALTTRGRGNALEAVVVGSGGKIKGLTLRGLTTKNRVVDVGLVNLESRSQTHVRCNL
ncbi:MAG: hypothetical protein Q7T55_19395, partial [Solirubrobacteraceae bacterium]|nr:hypothetical protein [Solirubrobacteraceae bacterium]